MKTIVMPLLMSLCAVLFPGDVLNEIWDLIGSVLGFDFYQPFRCS